MTTKKSKSSSPGAKSSSSKGNAEPAQVGGADLSKFQGYVIQTLARNEIRNAPYNPKKVNQKDFRRLQKVLKKHSLRQPLVYNKRTGNIVSGHDRIKALDILEGSSSYQLQWAVIDVSEQEEKELNLAFNMRPAQRDVDGIADLLRDMSKTAAATGEELSSMLDGAGMDLQELAVMLPDTSFFDAFEKADASNPVLDELEALQRDAERKPPQKDNDRRNATRDELRAERGNSDDAENHIVLFFGSYEERNEFLDRIGAEFDIKYVDGRQVLELLPENT